MFAKSLDFYRYNIEICIYTTKQKKYFCYLETFKEKMAERFNHFGSGLDLD